MAEMLIFQREKLSKRNDYYKKKKKTEDKWIVMGRAEVIQFLKVTQKNIQIV